VLVYLKESFKQTFLSFKLDFTRRKGHAHVIFSVSEVYSAEIPAFLAVTHKVLKQQAKLDYVSCQTGLVASGSLTHCPNS